MNISLGEAFESRANNLNLLRLLAALSVIYGHATAITGKGPNDVFLQYIGYKFIGGVAVDIFFVISGFLIARSVCGPSNITYFISSRLLRIYPGLIACIALSVFIVGPLLSTDTSYWGSSQTWKYLLLNGFAISTEYSLPGTFIFNHNKAFNGSLWSIAVEIRLYVFTLVLYMLGVFKFRLVFNGLFFLTIIIIYHYTQYFEWFYVLEYENHRHVSLMFMIGVFSYINRDKVQLNWIFLLTLLIISWSQLYQPTFGYTYTFVLPYLVFVLCFAPWGQWYNNCGDYSYGVYLYGWPCQQIVYNSNSGISNFEHALYASFLALCCAFLSWHVIEKPMLKLKKHTGEVVYLFAYLDRFRAKERGVK